MSKWKDESIKIIQMTGIGWNYGSITMYGLGTDDKIYSWSEKAGKWKKMWDTSDE